MVSRGTAIGTTDDVTDCGRTDLRSTIVLWDGEGEITYAGSECGRRIAGRPVQAEARKAQQRTTMRRWHGTLAG